MSYYGTTTPAERQLKRVQKQRAERDAEDLEKQINIYKRQKKAIEARDDLLAFTEFTMPDFEFPDDCEKSAYEAARFHKEVAAALEAVERGEIQQLIFCMPPRHGKTELATKRFAAWFSGRHPDQNIAVASYSGDMAQDFGADTRAIIGSKPFKLAFPTYKLRRGGNAKDNIQTERGGRLVFVGRGGPLTGRGAHLLLIDDIFKDDVEAQSETIRNQAWNWFTKVAMTRRMGKHLVVITMTRWHSDDIIGRLTDPENPKYNEIEARKWKIIRLPALAEDGGEDPLGREPGTPLWPERYGVDYLSSQQRIDPLGFAALFQQRPTVEDGVLFLRENLQFYTPDTLPTELRYYGASDFAVGLKQRNDKTVHVKVAVDSQNNIYIIDCFWQRAASDISVEALLQLGSGDKRPLVWWAEKGHISKSIGPFLRRIAQDTQRFMNIREVTPAVDKQQRAQSIAAFVAMGKVYFPRNAVWTERAVNELLAFPNGTHDDFVDALAYIGLGLNSLLKPGVKVDNTEKEPVFGTLAWVKHQDRWEREQAKQKEGGGF